MSSITRKSLLALAAGRPIISAPESVGDYLFSKNFGPIGAGNCKKGCFTVYKVGKTIVICGNYPYKTDAEITVGISENDIKKRSLEQVLAKLGCSIRVSGGYKSWGWLAKAVFDARFFGKETLKGVEFRPYHAYKGNYAKLSYSKIPEGLTEACEKLGLVAIKGNDAPRGGQRGDYIRFAFKDEKIVLDEKKGERI